MPDNTVPTIPQPAPAYTIEIPDSVMTAQAQVREACAAWPKYVPVSPASEQTHEYMQQAFICDVAMGQHALAQYTLMTGSIMVAVALMSVVAGKFWFRSIDRDHGMQNLKSEVIASAASATFSSALLSIWMVFVAVCAVWIVSITELQPLPDDLHIGRLWSMFGIAIFLAAAAGVAAKALRLRRNGLPWDEAHG